MVAACWNECILIINMELYIWYLAYYDLQIFYQSCPAILCNTGISEIISEIMF